MMPWDVEKARILRRHAVYMRERMQLPISDRQYLMWDWIFRSKFDQGLEKYRRLIYEQTWLEDGCLNTGLVPRLRISFAGNTLLGYRFTWAIATVLPLSSNDVIRHECNNDLCVNPRHLMVGDQRQNFEDYLAEEAYGTRFELLRSFNEEQQDKM